MNINGLIGQQALTQTLAQAVAAVKANPVSSDLRMQLSKLYCLQADWDRALRQLEIVAETDPEAIRQCELYKNLILSERLRGLVLTGEREAGNLGDALPEWCGLLNKANALYHAGQGGEGEQVRQSALEAASMLAGYSDEMDHFEWMADGDDRLGPVCEFISAGGYRWVPFAQIDRLSVEKPAALTDLVWAPATLVVNGRSHKGYIPARYPLASDSDARFLLGTLTEWHENAHGRFTGHGRKMWITSSGEYALFEAGDIHR